MKARQLISEYRRIAALGGNFRGLSVLPHTEEIGCVLKENGVQTLLDFGCGAGDQYRDPHNVHRKWGLKRDNVRCYDPAFRETDERPKTIFDAVISSDVLEHIPEINVPEAIDFMFGHARKVVWASVCCRPAKKVFEDGTNMHVTVHPIAWWEALFKEASVRYGDLPFYLVETP